MPRSSAQQQSPDEPYPEPGAHRGGPQIIPRPDVWKPGGPAPWFGLSPAERRLDLDRITEGLTRRGPGRDLGATFLEESAPKSAVLCALYEDAGEPWVLLTRRSARMRSHRHEISFPGGRHDPEDESFIATALREAQEEINLAPHAVTIIGELDRFVTGGSGSMIHPYVGRLIDAPRDLVANPHEVESIRRVPLSELLSDRAWREEIWTRRGVTAHITFFEIEGDTVWGATAAMLKSLFLTALDLPASSRDR